MWRRRSYLWPRQITINDLPVGRSVDETIRLVKAFQFTVRSSGLALSLLSTLTEHLQDEHGEVCPANWTEGSQTIKTDPHGKLEYFSTAGGANGEQSRKRPRID